MNDAQNWQAEEDRFRQAFPLEEDRIVIDFFSHFLDASSKDFLRYFEYLLDAKGLGFQAIVGCRFDIEEQRDFAIQGVHFDLDLTLGDPDANPKDYHETFVPYQTFLDMMRFVAQWRLKNFPDDEAEIRRAFYNRDLDFSLNWIGKGNGDSGKTWWSKCQLKHSKQKPNHHSEILKLKYGQ